MSEHDEDLEQHDTLHITVGGYVTGFVLSVILTAIPFWLVMGKVLPSATATTLVILGLAMVQIYVHMVFFLHMIVFDDDTGLAMTLGRTSLVTASLPEVLSQASLDLVVR